MITATEQARNLHIRVDGIDEPFIIPPVPGRRGQQLTDAFIRISAGATGPEGMEAVLIESVGEAVYERVRDELSLSEAEGVLLPGFYWQTVLGIDGVNAYISGGEGLAGAKKALQLLIWTLGISPHTTTSAEVETLIRTQTEASTKKVKQPQDRLPKA